MTNGDAHDRYLTLNGLRFHYRDWGAEDAPLLVVLHGLNSHCWDWDFLADAASRSYHVIALDQRGHGDSAWADDYGWPRYQEDIQALINAIGATPFTLLGYSVGGAIAGVYAANHPQQVQRLVIVDNAPTRTRSEQAPDSALAMREIVAAQSFSGPEELADLWLRVHPGSNRERVLHTTRHGLKAREDGRWLRGDDGLNPYIRPEYAASRTEPGVPPYIPAPDTHWALLPRIACETLLVHAEQSGTFTADVMQRVAATIPGCRLVTLPASSHRVHWDNPEGLLDIVLPFLGVTAQP